MTSLKTNLCVDEKSMRKLSDVKSNVEEKVSIFDRTSNFLKDILPEKDTKEE